jgi:hypothetical protein
MILLARFMSSNMLGYFSRQFRLNVIHSTEKNLLRNKSLEIYFLYKKYIV